MGLAIIQRLGREIADSTDNAGASHILDSIEEAYLRIVQLIKPRASAQTDPVVNKSDGLSFDAAYSLEIKYAFIGVSTELFRNVFVGSHNIAADDPRAKIFSCLLHLFGKRYELLGKWIGAAA